MSESGNGLLFDQVLVAQDPEYISLRAQPFFAAFRARLEGMWTAFSPHADPNFRQEFANQMHRRFWEMYLGCTLLELGYPLKSEPAGPDFFVCSTTPEIAIEATAPGPGSGPDQVTLPPPGQGRYVSLEPTLVRLRSGIEEKHRRYHEHLSKNLIRGDEPFVIGLSGRDVPYSSTALGPPLIVQAVFPIGEPTFAFSIESNDEPKLVYPYRDHVKKAKGAPVSTTLFTDTAYTHISAIIFSTVDAVNLPSLIGSDFIVIHNRLAAHPIPRGFIKRGLEFWEEDGAVLGKDWTSARTG